MSRAHAFWYAAWAAALLPAGGAVALACGLAAAAAAAALAPRVFPRTGGARARGVGTVGIAARLATAALGALALAASVSARAWLSPESDPDTLAEGPVRCIAKVVSSPEPRGEGWEWVVATPAGSLGARGREHRRLGVRLARGEAPGVAPGAWLEVVGESERLRGPTNPGASDFRQVARARGIGGWIRVRDPAGVHLLHRAGWLARAGEELRSWVRATCGARLPPDAAAYAGSLMLGETGRLPGEDRDGLVALGVIHIVIIAGLHLHIVHGLAGSIVARCLPRARFALPLAVTFAYAWLAHLHVPAQRVLVSLAAGEIARRRGLAHSARMGAAVAGAALLLLEPARARDASYVLSVAATWGLHELPFPAVGAGRWRPFQELLRASLLTQVAVWPLLAWTVGRGSLVGLPANLVAVPIAAAMLALLPAACAVSAALPWLSCIAGAGVSGGGASPALHGDAPGVLVECLRWVAWFPASALGRGLAVMARFGEDRLGSGTSLVAVRPAWVIAGLVALALLAHGPRRWRRAAALAVASLSLLMAFGQRGNPCRAACVRLAFLDVGQGDACLVTFPDGASVLVDGGPRRPGWDAGSRVVCPALDALAVRRLAWAAATHSDMDHLGGLLTLARRGRAGTWLIPPRAAGGQWGALDSAVARGGGGGFGGGLGRGFSRGFGAGVCGRSQPGPGPASGRDIELTPGLPPVEIAAGWTWLDASRRDTVYAVYPDASALRSGLSENDLCLVLEIATPEGRVLLTGDLGIAGEARLLAARPGLRGVALLKVGHHGSPGSSSREFLDALATRHAGGPAPVAAVSVGLRNPFGHPSAAVLDRLRECGYRVAETRREGALLFELRREGPVRVGAPAWTCGNTRIKSRNRLLRWLLGYE